MANKFVDRLLKLEGAVKERVDPFQPDNLLHFTSPGVNWLFGRTHGFPKGFSILLWGERKSGKSLLLYDAIGRLHQSDPDALAIKFDTEYRDLGQLPPEMAQAYGIDPNRLIVLQTNRPEDIFDPLSRTGAITEMLKEGAKIGLIGIDSTSDIMGRREAGQESVLKQQIGDHAITLQIGLKSILHTIRTHKIGLIMTAHARDEMDPVEQMRGNKKKPAVANAVLHFAEFFLHVEKNKSKDGRKDSLDRSFVDESKKDMTDDAEVTGHKIKVWMQDSSLSAKNRVAEFTLDYKRGIVNTHEEVFRLALNWGVIGRPNRKTYILNGQEFVGKPAMLEALEKDRGLQQFVLEKLVELENSVNFISSASQDSTAIEDGE